MDIWHCLLLLEKFMFHILQKKNLKTLFACTRLVKFEEENCVGDISKFGKSIFKYMYSNCIVLKLEIKIWFIFVHFKFLASLLFKE